MNELYPVSAEVTVLVNEHDEEHKSFYWTAVGGGDKLLRQSGCFEQATKAARKLVEKELTDETHLNFKVNIWTDKYDIEPDTITTNNNYDIYNPPTHLENQNPTQL
jgi:hypothetical protein